MNYLKPYAYLVVLSLLCQCVSIPQSAVYVSPSGDDEAGGTKRRPLATLAKALELAKTVQASEIVLLSGRHPIEETLDLQYSTGNSLTIRGEGEAVLSGGVEIDNFQQVGGNLYAADVKHLLIEKYSNYRQLFKDGKRMPRAQTPNGNEYLMTAGQIEKYKNTVKPWDFAWWSREKLVNPELMASFAFNKGDIRPEWMLPYVELLMHHSWESSYQTFWYIDTVKNEAFMNSPSKWPIEFFGDHGGELRYKLFNHRDFIDLAGEWMIDPEAGKLYYLAEAGEDPNQHRFIVPTNKQLVAIHESSKVKFENLTFSHTDHHMGNYVYLVRHGDSAYISLEDHLLSKHPERPQEFYPGYAHGESGLKAGHAIQIERSDSIQFSNCTFTGTGAYALWVNKGSSYATIKDCIFDDLGAGAVRIGFAPTNHNHPLDKAELPHHNVIENCTVSNGGQVIPGTAALWLANCHDNRVEGNHVFNFTYSGIHIGWNRSGPSETRDNLIKKNVVHDVLQVLTDGGGIYTLDTLHNCTLEANEIYSIHRPDYAAGSNSNGIFCDNKTRYLTIINNYVYDIKNAPIRFNDCHHSWMDKIENNYFDVDYIPVKYNNNYNMDFDEDGFMHVVIENNNYGVTDGAEWRAKYP